MPSADRYFYAYQSLFVNLSHPRQLGRESAACITPFFYQIALPNKSRTNHKRHEWDHKKAQKTDSVLFRFPCVPFVTIT